jgi:hypothetical protein
MDTFLEFIDKKQREGKRHLGLMKKLLERNGINVTDHREDDDPYLFVRNPNSQVSFDGIRVYQIGSQIAYRVQKQEDTHPYGKAYLLDLDEMYSDYLSDNIEQERATHMVIKTVTDEVKKFFVKSAEAETEIRNAQMDGGDDGMGKIMIRTTGTDYSNQVFSKG